MDAITYALALLGGAAYVTIFAIVFREVGRYLRELRERVRQLEEEERREA